MTNDYDFCLWKNDDAAAYRYAYIRNTMFKVDEFTELMPRMYYFAHIDVFNLSKLENIPQKPLQYLREQKIKLVIFYPYEAYRPDVGDWYEKIRMVLHQQKIAESNVILVYGDLNVEKYKSHSIKFLPFNCFEKTAYDDFHRVQALYDWEPLDKPTVDFLRKDKVFLFKNAVITRNHRQAFYLKLNELGLLKKSMMSWLDRYNGIPELSMHAVADVMLHDFALKYSQQECELLKKKVILDFEELPDRKQAFLTNDTYTNTWYSLVMETLFEKDVNFVTEKTYQPIINYHPFLIASNPYALRNLREDGYETFPEIFDESYDEETDTAKRFHMLIHEVQKSCQPGFEEKFKQPSVREKLKHNRKNFFDRRGRPHSIMLISSLSALAKV
jgi:hypothetical protein